MESEEVDLRQDLKAWQIFFIVASTIIGEGIFSGDGAALRTSGPGGTLLAILIIGLIVICVMECVSEFVQLFPCPNAIVLYIETFVDKQLAWVCGVAYWYTFASIFAALNLTAANFLPYWDIPILWQVIGFYILAPFALTLINLFGVSVFGWIESVGGVLKITLVIGTGILMYVLSGRQHDDPGEAPLYDGFEADNDVAANPAAAVCWNLPWIAYSFLGHESVAITAFEARSSRSLKSPSRFIAYFIFCIYMFTAIGELLLIRWTDNRLAPNTGGRPEDDPQAPSLPNTTNMAVMAAFDSGVRGLPGFLNACYIFSVLSASNSALYVASRTVYGLTRDLDEAYVFTKYLKKLSKVDRRTGVPVRAIMISVAMFFWLPFLNLRSNSYPVATLLEVLQITSSISCLIVWSVLCLAYIRYRLWLQKCSTALKDPRYAEFDRDGAGYRAWTLLFAIQPIPAYLGMIGSVLTVLVFTTATWWHNHDEIGHKFAVAYAAPLILGGIWLGLKAYAYWYSSSEFSWWVQTDDNFQKLHRRLRNLQYLERSDDQEQPDANGSVLNESVVNESIVNGSVFPEMQVRDGRAPSPILVDRRR